MAAVARIEEPGCLLYELVRKSDEPGAYRVLELYTSQADFDHHIQTAHFKAHYPQMAACYATKPEVEFLDALEPATAK
jgi:quinol monooxygenase YgiN